jgi:acyl-CoA thioester hydrolase
MKRKFSLDVTVHWSDVDLAGVVYFPHFFRYFSMTETEFYRSLGPTMLELEESLAIRLPRVDAHCRYLKPVHFGEQIKVELAIDYIGGKTIKYGFDVLREEELVAQGHLVIASVSMSDFKSVPLPDKLLEMLDPFTSSETLSDNYD